jgi:hypothetical protein
VYVPGVAGAVNVDVVVPLAELLELEKGTRGVGLKRVFDWVLGQFISSRLPFVPPDHVILTGKDWPGATVVLAIFVEITMVEAMLWQELQAPFCPGLAVTIEALAMSTRTIIKNEVAAGSHHFFIYPPPLT